MITYRILPGERLIIVTHHSKVSYGQVMDFRKKLHSDPAYSPEYDVIDDSRKLKQEYVLNEVQNIAKYKTPHSRVAMIASSDLSFGVGRTWEMLVEDRDTKINVFRDAESALSWLGKTDSIINILKEMAGVEETDP